MDSIAVRGFNGDRRRRGRRERTWFRSLSSSAPERGRVAGTTVRYRLFREAGVPTPELAIKMQGALKLTRERWAAHPQGALIGRRPQRRPLLGRPASGDLSSNAVDAETSAELEDNG